MMNTQIHKLTTGSHFAPINGINIHYVVSGNGPVCLFPTPGWGPSIELYTKSLKQMEKYFTMVWYDTRLSGTSTGPDDPLQYTSEHFIDDLDGLRDYLELDKMWVMGQSSGAYHVLKYGILHSNQLNGIIAISATAGRDSVSGAEFMKNIARLEQNPDCEEGTRIFTGKDTTNYTLIQKIQKILPLYFYDQKKIKDFETQTAGTTYSENAFNYTNASGNGSEILFPLLDQITVPTLIVTGDNDFICDKISQSDRIHDKIAFSSLIEIKDAGHFCWIEQPLQFFTGVNEWIENQL